ADCPVGVVLFHQGMDLAGDQDQQCISVLMHLSCVRIVLGHETGANCHPIDTRRRTVATLQNIELASSRESNDGRGEVKRFPSIGQVASPSRGLHLPPRAAVHSWEPAHPSSS